ncbi:hypothetical protein NSS79_15230 [Paenibacillus sp. FSL L8-0436]|uniref:hypothetical protein n=1 Tax=Paenibacillus sp. FSL L8-0436 TaxID=2954686 RepID=UPI003158CAD5
MSFFKKLISNDNGFNKNAESIDLGLYELSQEYEVRIERVTESNSKINRQTLLPKCKPNDDVTLKQNQNDDGLVEIEVWTKYGMVGFLQYSQVQKVTRSEKNGGKFTAKIHMITGGTKDKPNYGCILWMQHYVKKED